MFTCIVVSCVCCGGGRLLLFGSGVLVFIEIWWRCCWGLNWETTFMYCCKVLCGIGLCGDIMETSSEACLGVMLLLMSMGIWVGSCLSFLSMLDILA